jgi:release factor glutamine methyltransferase
MTTAGEVLGWGDLLREAESRLGRKQEARWMIEEVSGEPWNLLDGSPGRPPERARSRLESMIERRLAGEPLQYVLGRWSFRQLDLMVDRRVLIPRPETEQVVERALAEIDRIRSRSAPPRLRAVDLGTGSGAIALSLARERSGVEVWATEISPEALAVARANLAGLAGSAATRVRMVPGEWWSALPADLHGAIDVVVSNPPYVSEREVRELDAVVAEWEPRQALVAGPAGTEDLEFLIETAPGWLRTGGAMVLELAPHQAAGMADVARRAGFAEVEVAQDLSGRDRMLIGRKP